MNIKDRLYLSGMDYEAAKKAKEYGIGYEVSSFSWAPMLDNADEINNQRKLCKEAKRVLLHGCFAEMSPCAIDPLVRKLTKERFVQCISLAEELGAEGVIFHDGFIPDIYFPEWFVSESVKFWEDFMSTEIKPTSSPKSVKTIYVENVLDADPEPLKELLSSLEDDRFRICLDIGHANCKVSNIPIMKWIETLKPYIGHTHIHNNFGNEDLHNSLNKGNMDMVEVLGSLYETGCSFTIENQNVDESMEWLIKNNYI